MPAVKTAAATLAQAKADKVKAGTLPAGAPVVDADGRPWAEVAKDHTLSAGYNEHARQDVLGGGRI